MLQVLHDMYKGVERMKRLLLLLPILLILAACGDSEEDIDREDAIKKANDNLGGVLLTNSITKIWHIEDYMRGREGLDSDKLFRFTDEYIINQDSYDDLNGYEKGLAMKTAAMITKSIEGRYDDDEELFESDLEEYHNILEHGDNTFIDKD